MANCGENLGENSGQKVEKSSYKSKETLNIATEKIRASSLEKKGKVIVFLKSVKTIHKNLPDLSYILLYL